MKLHNLVAIVAASAALVFAGTGCSSASEDAPTTGGGEENLTNADAPLARFAPHLKSLRTPLESGQSVDQVAQTLLGSGRPAAFALQALCRLYEKEDDKFKTLRDDFKALEDGIGQYDKWNSIYQTAVSQGKDQATLDRLKAQSDAALKTFATMLSSRGFINKDDAKKPGLVGGHEEWLKAYKWKSRNEDREVVLKHLSKELDDLATTKYDMKILEVGDGVHELRRDLRWIMIEQLQVAGMITLKDPKTCAIPAYSALQPTDRYAQLRSSALEPNPCQVDACVVEAAAEAVNNLGNIKDQAEQEVNINGDADVVPVRLQPQAAKLYADIQTNKLFETYKTQIDACRDALKAAPVEPAKPVEPVEPPNK